MAPTQDVTFQAVVGSSSPSSPAVLSLNDDDIKAARRSKHEKDMLKRQHARLGFARVPASPLMPDPLRVKVGSAGNAPMSPRVKDRENRGAYAIPRRRREKQAIVAMAASCPAPARSWPPDMGELMGKSASDGATTASSSALATSAPEKRVLMGRASPGAGSGGGGSGSRRAMTLLDCASLFDEAGHMLSPDEFLLGSSPSVDAVGWKGRKTKRRVGRHRLEKRGAETAVDVHAMSEDAVVIEVLHALLPDVDVSQELNLHFLGSHASPREADVFDFEQDTDESTFLSQPRKSVTEVDLPKLQATLTHLLFGKTALPLELPAAGTSGVELVENLLTDRWFAHSLLQIVQLDVLAQRDAFEVILAAFRTMPLRRVGILKAVHATCLAIHEHQGASSFDGVTVRGKDFRGVSMKGCISFLKHSLAVMERDLMDDSSVFGESPEAIDALIAECCDSMLSSIELLARSSPKTTSRGGDENNQVEKYMEGSESVEATTYAALADVINRLTRFSPCHGQMFLQRMLRKWPQRNVQLEIFFVRFLEGVLVQYMMIRLQCPPDVTRQAFARLCLCIQSPHFLIAKEAATVCGNLPLMSLHLGRNATLRAEVAAALHNNATSHWNERIRQLSDEQFDLLLDFA